MARERVASLLGELESALRAAGLWEAAHPDHVALDSAQPFCVDTLRLPQWLQWVFLPRMRALLDARAPLPARCGIAAMAEMYFMGQEGAALERLIALLGEIDRAIEGG
jgi:uncharacterized protein YqcC (DUF446 family)